MEWFSLPILILFLSSSLSSEICNSDECNEASTFLLSLNDEKDACTDNFAHSCTSNARKIKETADNSNDAKMKNEDRIKFVEYVNSMNEEDVVISGIRKLNQSCMNFNGSLFEDISLNMDQMIKQMEPEHVSGFMTRGIPIYFKTKFVLGRKGANPILHFGNTDASMIYHRSLANKRINATGVNKYDKEYLLTRFYNQRKEKKKLEISNKLMEQFYDFEEKFFKFKLVDREYYQDFRVYTYNEFVETFSVANWSMASFLDGLASRTSVEHIIVEDPQGIHYAVSILAEMKINKTLNAYTKEAYLHKISFLHFSKKNMVDFPNPDAPDSTKVDDCLSLVTRYFPFLLRDIEKNTTDRDFIHWVEKATTAVKTTLYKQIDDSDWLEPFDKIFLLDIIMKINVFVYNDKNEEKEDGTLDNEALAKMMNSSDLLHNLREMEGSSTMGLKLEDGAYTFVQQRDVFLQLHTKKSEVYNSTIQVGISRIINTLGHEIGHHLTDHKQFIPTGRHLSDRFLRHLRNTLDCYRRVADEGLKDSSLYGNLTDVNNERVLREAASDILAVQIGPEAYSILNIPLLPNMTSMEEMYYRASTSSQFYCYNRELEDVIGFFTSTHPVQSQRVEYHRLFTKSPHFERTFNCTLKKSVCPNVF